MGMTLPDFIYNPQQQQSYQRFIMSQALILWLIFLVVPCTRCYYSMTTTTEQQVQQFLMTYNEQAEKYQRMQYQALWAFYKKMTPKSQQKLARVETIAAGFSNSATAAAESVNLVGLDSQTVRQMKIIRKNSSPTSKTLVKKLSRAISSMTHIFGNGKVCYKLKTGKCIYLKLIPDLVRIMSRSLDYEIRLFAWKGFRYITGPKVKPHFIEYVNISNIGAREHGWRDLGQSWRSEYEMSPGGLMRMMKRLWNEVKPLYQKFHGYIRYRLRQIYGFNNVSRSGPIPTHLLDMWGFDWSYLSNLVKPYPQKADIQLTTTMYKKGMTVLDMVRMAEDFYVSMGLEKMVPSFWKKSLFSHKAGEKVDCTISAWDFSPGDYRIKMPCASVNENELLTVIHEMGHIEYDMMYSKQPYVFRNGANPAFHEAVGDAVSLSARVPSYLKKVGLLPEESSADRDPRITINGLMKQALKNIAILPFAITIDFWRWKALSGEITPDRYNEEWWHLKLEYQGVVPPVKRTAYDFDPGANSHICNNTPYARYFLGAVLQFQFHQAMCQAADHMGPLHKCSIYGSKEAGNKLRAMLELGRSRPWQDALEVLTGQRFMDASAIKSYFHPLENWLDQQQAKIGYPVGW